MSWGIVAGAVAGPLIGGLLGSQGSSQSSQTDKDLPDWLKSYVLGANGQGGLLDDAQNLYRQQSANGGLNDMQRAGMEMQRQFLTSPQYTQGFDQMRNAGMSLMGRPAAGNPFTGGGSFPAGGGLFPTDARFPSGAPSAGLLGQQGTPFQYQNNPALLGAFSPTPQGQGVVAPPASAPAAPSMDDVLAELRRQQQAAINDGPHY